MSNGLNKDLSSQIKDFLDIIKGNDILYDVIKQTSGLGLPDHYIGAGCLAQTGWNHLSGYPENYGV